MQPTIEEAIKEDKFSFDNVVKPEIERNTYPRINWRAFFKGLSLTRVIAKFKAAGLNASQTYDTLVYENPTFSEEVKRRLKIGVAARFGEMKTAQSELKKVKGIT
jgi:hypothetical protein